MEKLVQQIIAYILTIPRPKNWVLLFFSFLFTLFLWYFVVGEDKVDMNVSIPVEIVNMPRELTISNKFKKQLDVTVSGQRSLIRAMASQDIGRSIDLTDATPGTVVIQNTPDSITLPRGISILRIQPTTLTLLLDRLVHKKLTISPVLNGTPPEGYELISVNLEPPDIEISGPESIIEPESFLNTKIIDISSLKSSTVKQVALDLKPDLSDLIGEPVVAVHLNVRDKYKEQIFSGVPILFDAAEDPVGSRIYQLSPPTVTVRAALPVELILETDDTESLLQARITPDSLAAGISQQPVTLEAPPRVRILEIIPNVTTLKIIETQKLKIAQ